MVDAITEKRDQGRKPPARDDPPGIRGRDSGLRSGAGGLSTASIPVDGKPVSCMIVFLHRVACFRGISDRGLRAQGEQRRSSYFNIRRGKLPRSLQLSELCGSCPVAAVGALMIVIFGASTDIGQRLARELIVAGHQIRRVSRSGTGDVWADLSTGAGILQAVEGAETIVSCAHGKFTHEIVRNAPLSVRRLVLTGSAWRYSQIPNIAADEIRNAEAAFLTSPFKGVMLHPTMIYGGKQENNIRRLLYAIRRLPFIPAPGGGHQIVQPIYVDDVVACLFAAVNRVWGEKHVIALGGPPLTWREMVITCEAAIQCSRPLVSVPAFPLFFALSILNRLGVRKLDASVVRRFSEDVNVSLSEIRRSLSVHPRDFAIGLSHALTDWQRDGALF